MASGTVGGLRNTCVSCNYWGGNRKASSSRYEVEYSMGDKGECLNSESPWSRSNQFNNASCGEWTKWVVLKE